MGMSRDDAAATGTDGGSTYFDRPDVPPMISPRFENLIRLRILLDQTMRGRKGHQNLQWRGEAVRELPAFAFKENVSTLDVWNMRAEAHALFRKVSKRKQENPPSGDFPEEDFHVLAVAQSCCHSNQAPKGFCAPDLKGNSKR
eukprot:1355796-Amorphochlora_amoeboformis.AAC.1